MQLLQSQERATWIMQQLMLTPQPPLPPPPPHATFLGYKEQMISLFSTWLDSTKCTVSSHCFSSSVLGSPPALCQVEDPCWVLRQHSQAASALLCFYFAQSHFCSALFPLVVLIKGWTPSPTFSFSFLITTLHQTGFQLERAALCQAYHLIHQRPACQLSVLHTPRSLPTTCRFAPCHFPPPLCCGNIQHHCQPVTASVAKITLSRMLGGAGDVSRYQHV